MYTTHPLHLDFEPEPGHADFVGSDLVKTFSLRVLREKVAFVARGLFVFAYTAGLWTWRGGRTRHWGGLRYPGYCGDIRHFSKSRGWTGVVVGEKKIGWWMIMPVL